jgi:hypothetical protein
MAGNVRFPAPDEGGVRRISGRFIIEDHVQIEDALAVIDGWKDDQRDELELDGTSLIETGVEGGRLSFTLRAQPWSRLWKGFLVQLTGQLAAVDGIVFECFFDEVAGAPHSASGVRRDGDDVDGGSTTCESPRDR